MAQQRPRDRQPPAWGGRLFLGRGWILYLGMGGPAATHCHHTTQLVVSLDGDVDFDVDGEASRAPVALIPRNVEVCGNDQRPRFSVGCEVAVGTILDFEHGTRFVSHEPQLVERYWSPSPPALEPQRGLLSLANSVGL